MPPTVCGKRSRSNSTSSSAASSHASVFSCSENDLFESGYETQTTWLGEQTPSSRKSSMSESSSQQIEHDLASWRADLLAASKEEQQRCAKRLRDLQGEVLRLANQVVSTAGKQPVQAAAPVASAPAPLNNTSGISPSSSASSSSSASDDTKNSLVDSLIGKYTISTDSRPGVPLLLSLHSSASVNSLADHGENVFDLDPLRYLQMPPSEHLTRSGMPPPHPSPVISPRVTARFLFRSSSAKRSVEPVHPVPPCRPRYSIAFVSVKPASDLDRCRSDNPLAPPAFRSKSKLSLARLCTA